MLKPIFKMLSLCLCLWVSSCSRDEEAFSSLSPDNDSCLVEFHLSTESTAGLDVMTSPVTRLLNNEIQNVNLYLYNDDYDIFRHAYTLSPSLPSMRLPVGTYRIYIIANAGQDLGVMDEETLLQLRTPETTEDNISGAQGMYMAAKETVTFRDRSANLNILLKRLAVQIHLSIRLDDLLGDAKLVHVQPAAAPASCSVFSDNRLINSADPCLSFPYVDLTDSNLKEYSQSYYQYENMQGNNYDITDPADRIEENVPLLSSYVSIRILKEGTFYDYKIYLGSNTTSDFNLRRNTSYQYNIAILGTNPDDLRVSKTEIIIWAGNNYTIGGVRYQNGFVWNVRTAYAELDITTENCDPDTEYFFSFRTLSGTFKSNWNMQYMVINVPSGQKQYLPITPGKEISVHKGNGETQIMFAFSNYAGTTNYNTTDNYFEFNIRDKNGIGRTIILSTDPNQWIK